MDDFSNAPLSIGEIKADKNQDGSLWSPRDCLIAALREIDSGRLNPEACIILVKERNENNDTRVRYFRQGRDLTESLGILTRATFLMQER